MLGLNGFYKIVSTDLAPYIRAVVYVTRWGTTTCRLLGGRTRRGGLTRGFTIFGSIHQSSRIRNQVGYYNMSPPRRKDATWRAYSWIHNVIDVYIISTGQKNINFDLIIWLLIKAISVSRTAK
ncbi:hypothetical protein J6590_079194 [Homalodisca vitripennis]|nr:hypothetical protein J6590_079194 [Homalodisca vitripennis]